jgi:hypothetical protein
MRSAAPEAFPEAGGYGVIVGISTGALPSAPGAPCGQRGIAVAGAGDGAGWAREEETERAMNRRGRRIKLWKL